MRGREGEGGGGSASWSRDELDGCLIPVCYLAGEPNEAGIRGGGGEGGGAPPRGQEMNEMVVIYWRVMLQGSRMKLVCVGDEEKVVGLHLMGQEMNKMVDIHQYIILQGSRMKLVRVGGEEKVVGLHLMIKDE